MDAQKLKFMMSVQLEIDKLEAVLGSNHQDVIASKALFQKLSQTEIQKKKPENSKSEYCDELIPIKLNTEVIREHLSITGNNSIDYKFVLNKTVKDQLDKDNLRMENARLRISKESELDRFYDFCVNAFYQVEQLINYYYGTKYPKFNDLVKHLEAIYYTDKLGAIKYVFKKNKENSISEITIASKLNAFTNEFFQNTNTAINLSSLRQVRNEGQHRCEIIKNNSVEPLHKFFKFNTFETVHSLIETLKAKIIENL
jgi:hypothetical protein